MHTETDKKLALDILRKAAPRGSTIYTILRMTSRSGMKRVIALVVIGRDRKPFRLDYSASVVLDRRREMRFTGGIACLASNVKYVC